MPLKSIPKDATPKEIAVITSGNIAELVKAGKPQNQAVAAAKQWEEDCLKKNKESMSLGIGSPLHKHAADAHAAMDAMHKEIDTLDPKNMTVDEMKGHMEQMSALSSKAWQAKDKLAQKAGC